MWFLRNAYLIFLLPAISFWLILLFGKRFKNGGDMIGIVAVGVSFILACGTAVQWVNRPETGDGEEKLRQAFDRTLFTSVDIGGHKTQFGIHIDGLTLMMVFVGSFTSLLVHSYATINSHYARRCTPLFATRS